MLHPKPGCLALLAALLCAGCVVTATPNPPTAALITATAPPTSTALPASPTPIAIVTATPTGGLATVIASSPTAVSSDTAVPSSASSTPIPSETAPATAAATAATTAASTHTPAPAVSPLPTTPPGATAQPAAILFFTISPQIIDPSGAVTLTWQATGQLAALYRLEPGGPLTDMRDVPLSGTLTLNAPDGLRNSVDYALYAGSGGTSASATVSAVIRCPDKYFFPNPPAGCPSWAGTLEPIAAEHFEHGVMVWVSSQNAIYILYNDNNSPRWADVSNQWTQGQPESDPSLVPPAGLYQPVRGFGMAWRTNDSVLGQYVRNRLGWATDTETALTGAFQCDTAPKYNNCYLSGPGGITYWLKPEFSGWEVWQGP